VHLASTLGSAVISARAELGSILVAALPEATLLTGQGGWLCGRAADGSDVFVAAHADGSLYVCERGKEPCAEPAFPPVRDPLAMQLSLAPKAAKSSPTARWWLGQGSGGGGGVPAGTCLAAPASARPLLRDTTSLDWKGAGDAPQQRSSMGSVAPRPCSMLTRYHRRVIRSVWGGNGSVHLDNACVNVQASAHKSQILTSKHTQGKTGPLSGSGVGSPTCSRVWGGSALLLSPRGNL
jgi:hypothetical protein